MLIALIISISGFSQTTEVTIGTGTSTNEHSPFNTFVSNNFSQHIYTAAEVGHSGTITRLSYNNTSSYICSRTISVYMAENSKASFSSASDILPLSNFTLVYNGSVTFNGWSQINLTTSFAYQDTANLIIAIVDNTSNYEEQSIEFASSTTTNTSNLYWFNDNETFDVNN